MVATSAISHRLQSCLPLLARPTLPCHQSCHSLDPLLRISLHGIEQLLACGHVVNEPQNGRGTPDASFDVPFRVDATSPLPRNEGLNFWKGSPLRLEADDFLSNLCGRDEGNGELKDGREQIDSSCASHLILVNPGRILEAGQDMYGVKLSGSHHAVFDILVDHGLFCRQEPRAHVDPTGSKGKSGGEALAICDTTACNVRQMERF